MRKLIFVILAATLPCTTAAEETSSKTETTITIQVPGLDSSDCILFAWNWEDEDFGLFNGGLLGYLDSIERKKAFELPWNAQLSVLHEVEEIIRLESRRLSEGLPVDATKAEINEAYFAYDYLQESIKEFGLPDNATEEDVRQARLARWNREAAEREAQVAADTQLLREKYNLPYRHEALIALELGLEPTSTEAEINHALCLLEVRLRGIDFGIENAQSWQEILEAAER